MNQPGHKKRPLLSTLLRPQHRSCLSIPRVQPDGYPDVVRHPVTRQDPLEGVIDQLLQRLLDESGNHAFICWTSSRKTVFVFLKYANLGYPACKINFLLIRIFIP